MMRKLLFYGSMLIAFEIGAIPAEIVTFQSPALPFEAIRVTNDVEYSRILDAIYFGGDYSNVIQIVSNTLEKVKLKDDPDLSLRLGYCYMRGVGSLKRDEMEAMKWIEKSHNLGNIDATYSLGVIYSVDRWNWPVKCDFKKSYQYLVQAAEAGIAEAMTRLGICFYYGLGVETNHYAAFTWFEKAAGHNECVGQYNQVLALLNGCGVAKDVSKAKSLMLRYGDKESGCGSSAHTFQSWLGDYFSQGIYEAVDVENAIYWYSRCCGGNSYAAKRLQELLGLFPLYLTIDLNAIADKKQMIVKTAVPPTDGIWDDKFKRDYILLRRIDGGDFIFGTPPTELGRYSNENRLQRRNVNGPYYIGVFEVTKAQWNRVMDESDCVNDSNPLYPVTGVLQSQMMGLQKRNEPRRIYFLSKLSEATKAWVRLPTEVEWEFACRGRGGNFKCCIDKRDEIYMVGVNGANENGLFDMLGNVWERVDCMKIETPAFSWFDKNDCMLTNHLDGIVARRDVDGKWMGIVRGSSFRSPEKDRRIGVRYFMDPNRSYDDVGLRIVMQFPDDADQIFALAESLKEKIQ